MERPKRQYPRFDTRLPECGARHDVRPEKGVYFCAHPGVISKHSLITAAVCRACPWTQLPLPKNLRPFHLPPAHDYSDPCGKSCGETETMKGSKDAV
jgi:hypothetical protein